MLQKPPVTLSGGFSFYIPYIILVNIKRIIRTKKGLTPVLTQGSGKMMRLFILLRVLRLNGICKKILKVEHFFLQNKVPLRCIFLCSMMCNIFPLKK